ncbi:MAG: hypothetical protein ACRDY7_06430 [Acidimicrobiia bacterium]
MTARRRTGSVADAKAWLHDAEAFMEAAELVIDPDVRATNAASAASAREPSIR